MSAWLPFLSFPDQVVIVALQRGFHQATAQLKIISQVLLDRKFNPISLFEYPGKGRCNNAWSPWYIAQGFWNC
jgi:hypothetical protein